jgi:hypothetical protein
VPLSLRVMPCHPYLPVKLFYSGHHKHPTHFLTSASQITSLPLVAPDARSCAIGSFISHLVIDT